ncbi:41775_t:CDS:1, partial [Gigaspora margarita]
PAYSYWMKTPDCKDTELQLLGEDTRPQLLDKSKLLLLDDNT